MQSRALVKTDDDAVAIGLPAAPVSVKHWDMDAAMAAKPLSYAEQVLVFSMQGLINQLGAPPVLSIDAGFQDFDWASSQAICLLWFPASSLL